MIVLVTLTLIVTFKRNSKYDINEYRLLILHNYLQSVSILVAYLVYCGSGLLS